MSASTLAAANMERPPAYNPYASSSASNLYPNLEREEPAADLKQLVRDKASNANQFANSILVKNDEREYAASNCSHSRNCSHTKVVVVDNYYWSSPFWWYPRPSLYFQPAFMPSFAGRATVGSRNSDEAMARAVMTLVGIVVVVAAGVLVGASVNRYLSARKEDEAAAELKKTLEPFTESGVLEADRKLAVEGTKIADLTSRICKRIKDSALVDLAIRVALLVGGGVTVASATAMISASALGTGMTIVVLALSAMIIKAAFERTDRLNELDALGIRIAANQVIV